MTGFVQTLKENFDLEKEGTSLSREFLGATSTFLSMSYILFVNPQILSSAVAPGVEEQLGQLLCATAYTAAAGCLLMGLIARYPFAQAPGMGMNSYFAITVIGTSAISWQKGLGLVFLCGIIAAIMTITRSRTLIVRVLPESIKHAMSAGIGLFIASIGAKNCGLLVDHPETLLALGSFQDPSLVVASAALLATLVLLSLKVRGAIFLGVVISAAAAILLDLPVYDGKIFTPIEGSLIQAPVWPTDLFAALELPQWDAESLTLLATLLLVNLFDSSGTLIALGRITGGKEPSRITHAFLADSLTTMAGAFLGMSPTTCYVESASGIRDGAKTGLSAVFVAMLFILATFCWPLIRTVPTAATAPAMMIVGSMMMASVKEIPWEDIRQAFPAFLTLFAMPMTSSIADGISLGIISYVILATASGKWQKLHWLLILLASLLTLRYALSPN